MVGIIIDNRLEWIESDLEKRGLKYESLREDILDHVCCLVEKSMEQGDDFDSSYSKIVEDIGNSRLQDIEHQTLLLLDKKFQLMKKLTYTIGLVSTLLILFGSLSKRMHWPGAGIELGLGLLAIVLVFLPLYFIVTYREKSDKKNIIYPIIGYLTIASLLVGAVFKIQHWPGASTVIVISIAVLIVGFVPLYLVNAFHKAEGEKIGLPYIIMLLVGIAIASLTFNVNMAKVVIDDYREASIMNEQRIKEVNKSIFQLQRNIEKDLAEGELAPSELGGIPEIHKDAEQLQQMIKEMLEEMFVTIKEPGIGIEDLQKADKMGVGRHVIVDNGWARKFITAAREYHDMLHLLIQDPVVLAQIDDHLQFTGKVWYNEWGYKEVINDPVIKIYYKHTDVSLGIALSEYVAMKYLLQE